MVNESIKQYVVLAVTKYDTVPNGYYGHKMRVFHTRGQSLEYLNAMNTAAQYEEADIEYLLYVFEPEPNTK